MKPRRAFLDPEILFEHFCFQIWYLCNRDFEGLCHRTGLLGPRGLLFDIIWPRMHSFELTPKIAKKPTHHDFLYIQRNVR